MDTEILPDTIVRLYVRHRDNKAKCEQADGSACSWHRCLKKKKIRNERRKAKRNPECQPAYRKFSGYEL